MILKYLRKIDWFFIVVCVVLITAQVYLDLKIPDYMSTITTLLTTGGTVNEVMDEGWKMLACALGSLATAFVVGYFAAKIGASLSKRLRELEFNKVEGFSMEEINRFSTASLITRSTNDITQVQMAFVIGLQVIIKAPILAVWAVLKIAGKNWEWTATTGIAIFAMAAVMVLVMVFVVPRFKKIQWLTDNVNRATGENLTGLRVVRAYNAEEYQEEKFEKANDDLTSNNLYANRVMSAMMPAMTTITSLLSLAIYWVGAYIVASASAFTADRLIQFSDMIVFSSYAMQIVLAFIMLVIVFMILPRAIVAAHRIEEIIDTESTIKDGTVTESPEGVEGEIVFKNVGFKYPGAPDYVLKNVDLEVKKGETVAFIGSTGSGKSTLINLVPRFYDPTEGEILIDGVNVRDYTLATLHRKIGYVPQKATMFNGTVTSNVNYGDTDSERTLEDVKKAVSIAQGTDFVEKMEGQYDGTISEGGTNLSGGQKQRLSIARAVCRKPEIYIFDDTFSALDYKTDRVLRSALKKETAGVTSLIVAQRIGTIMDADKIVVLNEGVVVGIGKHKELLDNCPIYNEIARSQLSEEELKQ